MNEKPIGQKSDFLDQKNEELVQIIKNWIDNAKIENIVDKKCHETYFVGRIIVGTGSSTRHIVGAGENLVTFLKQEHNLLPILDIDVKEWVIVLCGSIAVHLMTEQKRDHYKLEQLIESLKQNDQ